MANPWVTFESLLTRSRRTIAQVQSTDGVSGRVNVIQVGDSSPILVESNGSTYVNNTYVFIEGGIIVGQATNVRTIVTELLS